MDLYRQQIDMPTWFGISMREIGLDIVKIYVQHWRGAKVGFMPLASDELVQPNTTIKGIELSYVMYSPKESNNTYAEHRWVYSTETEKFSPDGIIGQFTGDNNFAYRLQNWEMVNTSRYVKGEKKIAFRLLKEIL